MAPAVHARRVRVPQLLALALGACLGMGACSDAAGPKTPISGERIYRRNCARCHGLDGKPTKEVPNARDLSNAAFMSQMSDDQLRATIKRGKPPAMPGFGEQFMRPSLDALVAYTRSLSDPQRAAAQSQPEAESDGP